MKCRQCHYWNKTNDSYKCNRIDGNAYANAQSDTCELFDYWKNYIFAMSEESKNQWLEISGEVDENGQINLF